LGKRGPQKGVGGRPKKPLAEKLAEGNLGKRKLSVMEVSADELIGSDMPSPKDFLSAEQKNGMQIQAYEVFKTTWAWLRKYNCEQLINQESLEQYSMAVARWIQCEEVISQFGFLAKHPTTGAAIASPYVSMEREYSKHANLLWCQIHAIVKENSSVDYGGQSPQDDVMERLLSARKGK